MRPLNFIATVLSLSVIFFPRGLSFLHIPSNFSFYAAGLSFSFSPCSLFILFSLSSSRSVALHLFFISRIFLFASISYFFSCPSTPLLVPLFCVCYLSRGNDTASQVGYWMVSNMPARSTTAVLYAPSYHFHGFYEVTLLLARVAR